MILAYARSGILQAVTVVRETPKAVIVRKDGEPRSNHLRIPKGSSTLRLFDNVDDACKWLGLSL